MPHPTPLLVVSWYRLFAECLAVALRRLGHFSVVTADFDKPQICAHVENNPSSIILLRDDHPGEPCLELIASVSRTFDTAKVLLLGDTASDLLVVNYLEAGARGYIPEDVTLSDIGKAIQLVEKGEVVCSQSATPAIFGRLENLYEEAWGLHERESQILTLRESEIVELMADGLTNGQIADRLSISAHTVKNHVHNILGKLQVNRRLLAVQEVYGRKSLNAGAEHVGRASLSRSGKAGFTSSVGDETLTSSPKNRNSEVVRGHWAGR